MGLRSLNRIFICVFVSLWSLLNAACSIPNLEDRACLEARDVVREFYSFHIGNEMSPSVENLSLRAKFLTPELRNKLGGLPGGEFDYFTAADHYPKAFQLGGCRRTGSSRAELKVLLFWKDDVRSEQREVWVGTVKGDDTWLIDSVKSDSSGDKF